MATFTEDVPGSSNWVSSGLGLFLRWGFWYHNVMQCNCLCISMYMHCLSDIWRRSLYRESSQCSSLSVMLVYGVCCCICCGRVEGKSSFISQYVKIRFEVDQAIKSKVSMFGSSEGGENWTVCFDNANEQKNKGQMIDPVDPLDGYPGADSKEQQSEVPQVKSEPLMNKDVCCETERASQRGNYGGSCWPILATKYPLLDDDWMDEVDRGNDQQDGKGVGQIKNQEKNGIFRLAP
uniref:Uncharacterized protein n=1 Tax=Chenopodium quinoa TaxID=63459 RepID=A0A803KQ16_CHEQI